MAVIVDIVLGSPVANAALGVVRQQAEDASGETKMQSFSQDGMMKDQGAVSKERIDSKRVAEDAIHRARNSLELRNFLDSNKSDRDRMDDIKRKMDDQVAQLERNSQALADKINNSKRNDSP